MTTGNPTDGSNEEPVRELPEQTWDEVMVEGDADKIRDRLQGELSCLLKQWSRRLQRYCVLVLYSDWTLGYEDVDRIYQALNDSNPRQRKDVLLVLVSRGGYPIPAYQISKLCRESAHEKFIVCVPRHAKSAATMICLGADAVHMGPLGHLGPIDPQWESAQGGPVSGLALQNSLLTITQWVAEYPGSQGMWAEVLLRDKTFDYGDIGEFERITESAAQYAERLLVAGRSAPDRAAKIAKRLVYEYKDHGFAIDRDEARAIFGEDSVVVSSNELSFGEEVYRLISKVDKGLEAINFNGSNTLYGGVKVVGSLNDDVILGPPTARQRGAIRRPEGDSESNQHTSFVWPGESVMVRDRSRVSFSG